MLASLGSAAALLGEEAVDATADTKADAERDDDEDNDEEGTDRSSSIIQVVVEGLERSGAFVVVVAETARALGVLGALNTGASVALSRL